MKSMRNTKVYWPRGAGRGSAPKVPPRAAGKSGAPETPPHATGRGSTAEAPPRSSRCCGAVEYKPVLFFAADFLITWIPLWTFVIGMRQGWLDFGLPFMIAAGTSATVLAAVFVHSTKNRGFIRSFWRRAFDPRLIGAGWWLFIILMQTVINLLAIGISLGFGGSAEQFAVSQKVLEAPVIFFLMTMVYGPLPEELGWRGYGLDALRSRMNLLKASLLLGSFWMIWHLPLYFMPGSFQRGLLEYPPAFLAYVAAFFPVSIIMSWVYYKNGRSTLSAIMIHFFGNLNGELFSMALETRVYQAALSTLLAGFILWRDRDMFTQREFWVEDAAGREESRRL